MLGARPEGFPQSMPVRPALISHQSNSVPSTPQQRARKMSFESRSPSPTARSANHSPRSAYSESSRTLPPLRKLPPSGCKFETGMAYSRRRMPYSLGGDKLEKAKSMPKKQLNPKEESKLSGDMRELYDRLLPSAESDQRRGIFVRKLEDLLNNEWPGNSIKVNVFGSSGNLLCTSDSDVDICITTPMKELENVCMLANALAEHGMERVVCVPHAKVPIVKIWDPELQLACDMNVNNTLALENTRMIKTYVEIDERVRPLAMIIKHWTKKRILNDAALGGTLSSYTWICMIINFLQTREPPILPVLHQRPHQKRTIASGEESSFADDIDSLRGFGSDNKETLGELLFFFFRHYGHEVDYDKDVISVRLGKLISKVEKGWHLMQNNRLCVEEPFNISRNLGNTADDTSFRGLHMELRRAFTLIAEGVNLDECCEQYIFPAEEERIWEKPPPQPRPILSRSTSKSGKDGKAGGGASRGGRYTNSHNNRNSQASRRASSGAFYGSNGTFNTFQNHHLAFPSQPYYLQAHQTQHQLHDQLFQRYQLLQVQENELRFQLLQQAHAQANAFARAQARGQGPSRSGSQPFLNGHLLASLEEQAASMGIRPEHYLYHLQYGMLSPQTQHGTQTNPSSPSMAPASPELRRSLHRSSNTDGPSNGPLRSHSQPARAVATALGIQGLTPGNISAHGPAGSESTQRPAAVAAGHEQHTVSNAGSEKMPGHSQTDSPEDTLPKEYVGYFLGGSPPARPFPPNTILQPIPAYNELAQRRRRVSPEGTPPNILDRRVTRSPSPVARDGSKPANGLPTPRSDESNKGGPVQGGGLLIVNGSNTAAPTGVNGHQLSASDRTSFSENRSRSTSATGSDAHCLDHVTGPNSAGTAQQVPYPGHFLMLQTEDAKTNTADAVNGRPYLMNSTTTPVASPPSTENSPSRTPTSRSQMTNGDYGNSSPVTPTSSRQRASRRFNGVQPLDLGGKHAEQKYDQAPAVLPLLSPVREMRTPSPTTNRGVQSTKEQTRNISHKAKADTNSHPPSDTSGKRKSSDANGKMPNGHMTNGHNKGNSSSQASGWHQSTKKNNKKKKSDAHKSHASGKARGEPLPEDESQRKGG
ncbi:MAG: hypothetical protein M1819_004540 [Sarea resinae]|nr:MAG: hypothetical protein M1819_004540 [Sarea resinae]